MNLIPTKVRTVSDSEWYTIPDFRKDDHYKVLGILNDMFKKLSNYFNITYKIDFINKLDDDKTYLSEYATYMNMIVINLAVNGVPEKPIKIRYPALVNDNFFIMNGSIYVPLMFLERSPIDRINEIDETTGKNVGRILLNILPSFNITFDFVNERILYRGKKAITNNMFFSLIYNRPEDQDYVKYLIDKGIMTDFFDSVSEEDMKTFIKSFDLKSLNILKSEEQISVADFFDELLLLDYFKGMFEKIYGVSTIREILKIIVDYYLNDTFIDMSDLRNRRIVVNEYLINPIFEYYLRFLRNITEKHDPDAKKVFSPTMNPQVVITSGFRGMMHGGSYYNISLPFPTPLLYKVSQSIYIIGEKVPRSWTSNHPSAYGKICPISVSAQNMGENLVFTSDVRLDKYGLIEGTKAILAERPAEAAEEDAVDASEA